MAKRKGMNYRTGDLRDQDARYRRTARDQSGLDAAAAAFLKENSRRRPKASNVAVVIYRPRKGTWDGFEQGDMQRSQIMHKIVARENDGSAGRDWPNIIPPNAFDFRIISDQPDVESAIESAKAKGDKFLPYKKPVRPSGKAPGP